MYGAPQLPVLIDKLHSSRLLTIVLQMEINRLSPPPSEAVIAVCSACNTTSPDRI